MLRRTIFGYFLLVNLNMEQTSEIGWKRNKPHELKLYANLDFGSLGYRQAGKLGETEV